MPNPGLTNLSAWWALDETSGTRADEQGNVNLADSNTVLYGGGRHLFSGNAADFDAANQESLWTADAGGYLNAAGNIYMSMGCWIKAPNVSLTMYLMAKWGATYQEYVLNLFSSKASFTVHDTNGSNYTVTANTFGTLSNDEWYFIGVYFNPVSNQIGIGVNDVWDTLTIGTYGIDSQGEYFRLGKANITGSDYDGLMDDAFFYKNRLLTPDEWTWLYNFRNGRRYEDISEVAPPTVPIITKPTIPVIFSFDEDMAAIGIIDDYKSLNWAERYNNMGDFELELSIDYLEDPRIDFGNFLYIPTSDRLMVVEDKKRSLGSEGASILVNGRGSESILKRRTLLSPQTFDRSAELFCYRLVEWHVRSPVDTDREIGIFDTFATLDPWPPAMLTLKQYCGQFELGNIYDLIEAACVQTGLGFKIIPNDLSGSAPELYFMVYDGVDRSLGQSVYPPVLFSDTFDNIMSASFYYSIKDKINTVYVVSNDSVYPKTFVWLGGSDETAGGTEPTGINRFESLLETDVNRDSDEDEVDDLSDAEILAILESRGEEVIINNATLGVFDGDVDTRGKFVYNEDFFLGDFVECMIFGNNVVGRVTEVVRSYTDEGEKLYIGLDFEGV